MSFQSYCCWYFTNFTIWSTSSVCYFPIVSAHIPKHSKMYTKGHILLDLFPWRCVLSYLTSPQKATENTYMIFLVLKAASWLVKQISFDRPDWREASNFWSLACNVTIPVWHKLLDCGYFYCSCVLAGDLIAKVGFCVSEVKGYCCGADCRVRLRLCNCRVDAPSRVPAPKCLQSHSIWASRQLSRHFEFWGFGLLFFFFFNKMLSK